MAFLFVTKSFEGAPTLAFFARVGISNLYLFRVTAWKLLPFAEDTPSRSGNVHHCMIKGMGVSSQVPPSWLVPPLVGEVGTSSVQVISPSLDLNVTCSPVLPPAELFPPMEVAWYVPAPVARFTSSMYIEPAQSGPYGVPPLGFWHHTQNPATM